jgi:hypothetical protein
MAARSCCGELAALACRRSALLPCDMARTSVSGMQLMSKGCTIHEATPSPAEYQEQAVEAYFEGRLNAP